MSILARIFGRAKRAPDAPISQQQAVEIIQKYGAILENGAPAPGCVADASKLPFSKAQIKEALVTGLKATTDSKMKGMLKVAYIHLADWQDGVGSADQGLDLSRINPEDDPVKLAEQVLAKSEGHDKWVPIALAEEEALKKELERQGLW